MINRSVLVLLRQVSIAASIGGALAAAAGCSSSSSPVVFGMSGAVTGVADTHCMGVSPVVLNANSCHLPAGGAATPAPDVDGGGAPEFGETLYNSSGNDDDCKYTLSFTDSPTVKVNETMTFKLMLKKLADGSPATGGVDSRGDGVNIEGFMMANNSHTLPNTTPPMTAAETPANSGVYTISPVKFDAPGRWVVRFHFYESCTDSVEDSPHGHGGFFFDVP